VDGWYGNSEASQLTQDALLSASTCDVRTLVEVRKQTIVIMINMLTKRMIQLQHHPQLRHQVQHVKFLG
jgi:hypothetical protein